MCRAKYTFAFVLLCAACVTEHVPAVARGSVAGGEGERTASRRAAVAGRQSAQRGGRTTTEGECETRAATPRPTQDAPAPDERQTGEQPACDEYHTGRRTPATIEPSLARARPGV